MEDYLLYYCEITATYSRNSGIQRVSRFLAKALIDNGIKLVPVGVNDNGFYILSEEQLETFSEFNGPKKEEWTIISKENICDIKKILIADLMLIGDINKPINTVELAKKNNIEIFFIFYDATPLMVPRINPRHVVDHFSMLIEALRRSDGILSISKKSTDDLLLFSYDTDGLLSIPIKTLPLPNQFFNNKKIAPKINNSKFVEMLMVSTIEPRKNYISILKALKIANKELNKDEITLKFNIVGTLGGWRDFENEIMQLTNDLNVEFHYDVTDENLIGLYSSADFTVYPSIYEGYGLPVAESLHFNTPVICSNNSSLKELAEKGGCITFSPFDINDIANKIILIAKDMNKRQELINEIQNIKNSSWLEYAQECITFIKEKK